MKIIKIFLLVFIVKSGFAQQICPTDTIYPFIADSNYIKIWNKSEYVPFFIKGMNMGIAGPGKHPGDLQTTNEQYSRWFSLIKEAGFNCMRTYTLHFPNFYLVLDSFNSANPKNPLYLFQGVWLDEGDSIYRHTNDLHLLDSSLDSTIEENVDAIHGNVTITQRSGKAYGAYAADVSKWTIAYIVGREIQPIEALSTKQHHPGDTLFNGTYFTLTGNPTEVFGASHLDHILKYENDNYNTQRPVSFACWPTLDPLYHPYEHNRMEDTASIDLNNMDFSRAPCGIFASFNAYPYYPDFVGSDSLYNTYTDAFGTNNYLGYITDLKNHFNRIPLMITEVGIPSSWGVAHFVSSGMNHGGVDQQTQGEYLLRLFHNAQDVGCAGLMSFSLMDEWFKTTWITYPLDYDQERRILWHNVMGPEQNFGLLGFQRPLVMQDWATFNPGQSIQNIKAAADYDFFHISLSLGEPLLNPDELWISLDTYRNNLGESILPNGDTVQNRAEFVLHITNYSAELYVTQAYDVYGIGPTWSGTVSSPDQLYHSISTDGHPWVIERWLTNNYPNPQLQYIGNLKVNSNSGPESSLDAIALFHDSVHIRLPWTLLEFVDPSSMRVLNDLLATQATEDIVSDGIQVSVFYHDQKAEPASRFTWNTWNTVTDAVEYKKESYYVVKNGLPDINNLAIAVGDIYPSDTIPIDIFPFNVSSVDGLLKNDFDLDGNNLQALAIGNAHHGFVSVNLDGSFIYNADPGYVGDDYFEYAVFDGYGLSKPTYVCLNVSNPNVYISVGKMNNIDLGIFPNPAKDIIQLKANKVISGVSVFSSEGKLLKTEVVNGSLFNINISEFNNGIYYLKSTVEGKYLLNRFTVIK